jgi:type I restriction enzyme S subunit
MIGKEIERYINKTTQPNVGLQSIKQFLFPLPPLEEQHRIVAKIEELLPYCDRLAKN